jgi:hypothetical protein
MSLDLSKSIKFNSDRSIDLDATLSRVKDAVVKYNTLRTNDLDTVAATVDAVFAQYPGACLSTDALVGFVLRQLGATPETWGTLSKRTIEYVKSYENSRFSIKVGKGITRLPPAV